MGSRRERKGEVKGVEKWKEEGKGRNGDKIITWSWRRQDTIEKWGGD